MQDRPARPRADSATTSDATEPDTVRDTGGESEELSDTGRWRKYRKWASTRRRKLLDRSLYTWKGYRRWSEQVKREWPEG